MTAEEALNSAITRLVSSRLFLDDHTVYSQEGLCMRLLLATVNKPRGFSSPSRTRGLINGAISIMTEEEKTVVLQHFEDKC